MIIIGNIGRMVVMVPCILWIMFVFFLSSQPFQVQSIQPFLKNNLSEAALKERLPDITIQYRTATIVAKEKPFRFIEFIFRKSAHLFVYGMLAVWAYLAFYSLTRHRLRVIPLVLGLVLCVAMLDEWNQASMSSRTGALEDIVLDLVGGIIGLCSVLLLVYFRKLCHNRRIYLYLKSGGIR